MHLYKFLGVNDLFITLWITSLIFLDNTNILHKEDIYSQKLPILNMSLPGVPMTTKDHKFIDLNHLCTRRELTITIIKV